MLEDVLLRRITIALNLTTLKEHELRMTPTLLKEMDNFYSSHREDEDVISDTSAIDR